MASTRSLRRNTSQGKMARPTRSDISDWVTAIGGSMSVLPYVWPSQGQRGENGQPYRVTQVQFAGIWGNFWWEVSQDMAFSMLQIEDEVRGSTNNKALPDNWIVRIPPTCPSKCLAFRNNIFTSDPQFSVTFPGLANSGRRQELERKWTAYLMNEIQREEQASDQAPLDSMKQHCVDYGLGIRYDVLDLSRWPERPKKKRKETRDDFNARMKEYEAQRRSIDPFVVRTVHPMNFAYDMTSTPPKWCMIREPIFPWDAQERYPNWRPGQDYRPVPGVMPLTKVEFWFRDWHGIYINGEPALGTEDGADEDGVAPNPYGHIPITVAAGAAGEADLANRPEVVLQGIIRKQRPIFIEDALLFNLLGVYERKVSFGPKTVIKGPDTDIEGGKADQIEADLMAGPQVIARIGQSWSVETIPPAQLPPEIATRRNELNQIIDMALAPDVASGAWQEGPAAKMQLQLGQIQKKTSQYVLHMEQALEQWGLNRLYALRHLDALQGEKVGANLSVLTKGTRQGGNAATDEWADLDPADLPDFIQVKCNLTSDSETEKARRLQSALALFEKGLISDYDFYEEVQDVDPAGKVASLIEYQIRQTVVMPALRQVAQSGLLPVLGQVAQDQGYGIAVTQDGGMTWQNLQGQPTQGPGPQGGIPQGGEQPPAGMPQPPSGPPTQIQTGLNGTLLPGESQPQGVHQQLNPSSPLQGGSSSNPTGMSGT